MPPSTSRYHQRISGFAGKKVLVIGDLLLDRYLRGTSVRLCPEAPVPVVDIQDTTVQLGGAANTACNLAALGAEVFFCSIVGADEAGIEARALLRKDGIHDRGVCTVTGRKTLTKSRVVSGNQVVTRIDEGTTTAVEADITQSLQRFLQEVYPVCDAVVISDYDKGLVTDALIGTLLDLRDKHKALLAIDSKRLDFFACLHPDGVKPNYEEAAKLIGILPSSSARAEEITRHAGTLQQRTKAGVILATLDAEGALIIQDARVRAHVAAPPVSTPQVAGAGDSFLSAWLLARTAGGDLITSTEIAAAAACIAVGKACTATCSAGELKRYFNLQVKYVPDLAELSEICQVYHEEGKRIVFTNGCFDILHSGHVTYLHHARALGDVLIVGLNNDESISRLKGRGRPINALEDRLQVLSGLSAVDHIIAFGTASDDTPVPLIRVIRPHLFAKGGDYDRAQLPEAPLVEHYGGKVVLIDPVPDHSTTRIIHKMRQQQQTIPDTPGHDDLEKL